MICRIFLLLALVLVLSIAANSESYSNRRRRTKELEEKITKLDDGTKQRIFAMKASGMPHDAIADKITYQAGGKTTAKRIVDAMLDDNVVRKPGAKKTAPKQTATKQNKQSNTAAKKNGKK